MKTRILFLAPALLFTLNSFAQQVSPVWKLEYSSTADYSNGQAVQASQNLKVTRYYAPDGTVRTETQDFVHNRNTVSLANEKLGYEIWLDDANKTATRVLGLIPAAKNHSVGTLGDKQELGASRIQGYTCDGYRNQLPDGVVIKHWFCKDPRSGIQFLGRIETTRGNSTTLETLQSATPDLSYPREFFSVPDGYKIVDKTPAELSSR